VAGGEQSVREERVGGGGSVRQRRSRKMEGSIIEIWGCIAVDVGPFGLVCRGRGYCVVGVRLCCRGCKDRCMYRALVRGGGLGSRPKKMYGERLGDGVEYHLMGPTPRR